MPVVPTNPDFAYSCTIAGVRISRCVALSSHSMVHARSQTFGYRRTTVASIPDLSQCLTFRDPALNVLRCFPADLLFTAAGTYSMVSCPAACAFMNSQRDGSDFSGRSSQETGGDPAFIYIAPRAFFRRAQPLSIAHHSDDHPVSPRTSSRTSGGFLEITMPSTSRILRCSSPG